MGVDFAAILAHPFDNSNILTVPDRMNADDALRDATARFHDFVKGSGEYPLLSDETRWHWQKGLLDERITDSNEVWDAINDVHVAGAGITAINFGRAACHFSTPFKWSRFAIDEPTQIETRKICCAVAKAFSGNKAIYLPDSGPWRVTGVFDLVLEGATFQQIEDWLQQNIGESAPNIKKAHDLMQTGDLGSYFIDDFADLKIES